MATTGKLATPGKFYFKERGNSGQQYVQNALGMGCFASTSVTSRQRRNLTNKPQESSCTQIVFAFSIISFIIL